MILRAVGEVTKFGVFSALRYWRVKHWIGLIISTSQVSGEYHRSFFNSLSLHHSLKLIAGLL